MLKQQMTVDEALEYVKDELYDILGDLWKKHCDRFNFNTAEDHEAYGDTYVSTGRYITDESDHECRERFENDMDANALIDELSAEPSFKNALNALVEAWAYEKELEV